MSLDFLEVGEVGSLVPDYHVQNAFDDGAISSFLQPPIKLWRFTLVFDAFVQHLTELNTIHGVSPFPFGFASEVVE